MVGQLDVENKLKRSVIFRFEALANIGRNFTQAYKLKALKSSSAW